MTVNPEHVNGALRILRDLRATGKFVAVHGREQQRDTVTVEHPDKGLRNLVHAIALRAADPFAIDMRQYAGRWVIRVCDDRAAYLEHLAFERLGESYIAQNAVGDMVMHVDPNTPAPLPALPDDLYE